VIETGGFVLLFAWLIFAGLLAGLGYLILRGEPDRGTKARHRSTREPSSARRGSSRPES
jgi:hypothetical protein